MSSPSYVSAVINGSKRKRVQSPSPEKKNDEHEFDVKTSQTSLSTFDPESKRWSTRKRRSKVVAKSQANVSSKPAPLFDDELPANVGCQTELSQNVLNENELIRHYINIANDERVAKNKFRSALRKEAKVTEFLTDSITVCLEICENGMKKVQASFDAFPRSSFSGEMSQSQVNVKILLEAERNKQTTEVYREVIQGILDETSRSMDKFIEIKKLDIKINLPEIKVKVPDFKKSTSLLSQIITLNETHPLAYPLSERNSTSTSSQIASRHSTRTPARTQNMFSKARKVKFDSPLTHLLQKETIELEAVNTVANIEIGVPNTQTSPEFNLSQVVGHSSPVIPARISRKKSPVDPGYSRFEEVNSKDINFKTFNISQDKIKTEASSAESTKDLELVEFSEEWLIGEEAKVKKEWEEFCKSEALSDNE